MMSDWNRPKGPLFDRGLYSAPDISSPFQVRTGTSICMCVIRCSHGCVIMCMLLRKGA